MGIKGASKAFQKIKNILSFQEFMGIDDPFSDNEGSIIKDPYRSHAWVNIAVSTLMRNIGRASFRITKDGEYVTSGRIFNLFRDVNPVMNRFDLWKVTSAWWFLEGEAFWFFGDSYRAGIPEEIFILNPRRMRSFSENGRIIRWFYSTEKGEIPILPDEIIHFREWNPWNELRGVSPLIALSQEIEQDERANTATTKLLRNSAVPEGLLKTDQVLREEEADRLEKRWESVYGKKGKGRRIAVLGKGTSFEPLTMTPAALKFFDLKRWNIYTILAKYGIPPKVAYLQDTKSPLSGKDTAEQHAAFWKYTIIPTLRNFEQIIETQFFTRFNLKVKGVFDISDIPELQESEAERSKRDIDEISAGIKTINDVLTERGHETKSWGDVWYRPSKLVPVSGPSDEGKRGESYDNLSELYERFEERENILFSIFEMSAAQKNQKTSNNGFLITLKAVFKAEIDEITKKLQSLYPFEPLFVGRITDEAVEKVIDSNSLHESLMGGGEEQKQYFFHLLMDEVRIFALGKLGFRYYRFITKCELKIKSKIMKVAERDFQLRGFDLKKKRFLDEMGYSSLYSGEGP
jgi:HK97 family phage portal protein